jgi:hypothetical protein
MALRAPCAECRGVVSGLLLIAQPLRSVSYRELTGEFAEGVS